MNLKPDAIIATWMNDESTRGFNLLASGDLVEVSRESIGSVWSPPSKVASLRLSGSYEPLQLLLGSLVAPAGLDPSDPKWEGAEFPSIDEVEREQLLDRRIQHRLATDRAYLNAANAQQQAERERVIEDEECLRLDRQMGEARARREA